MSDSEDRPDPDAAGALSALESLFHQAMALPASGRAAFVDAQLAGDPRQARLLKRMLGHAEAEATGLGAAIGEFARDSAAPRDRSGEVIGRYRLTERIRYGGMAEVYRAARDDGEFEHEVALKVVRGDRVRPEVNDLFAAERALMARIHHPNVVRLFDGGTTGQGEAWFVMELLDGQPLPAGLAEQVPDGDQQLRLLQDLFAALAHVHAQLIVHRDLKPENVLLCRTPQGLAVKLLDFGIAARLSSGLSSPDVVEDLPGAGWYSPGYAAPETRDGQAQGVAADLYSLGKLLLDCVPHVPPRLRGELQAMGERAAQNDPSQRYPSAASMADDLARMRRREPISLFQHRRLHVLQRAVQRHRWVTLGIVAILLAGSLWLWRESTLRIAAEQATARAELERDRAAAMRDFLLRVFDRGNPSLNGGAEPRVSEMVSGELERLQQANDLDPESHYQLLERFASLLLHLDRRDLADRAYVQAAELAAREEGVHSVHWVAVTSRRGQLASRDGRFDDASRLFQQARDAFDELPDSIDKAREGSVLYSSWGASAQREGKLDEAERLIETGLTYKPILQAANDDAGDETSMRVTLGAIQSARGKLDDALQTFQDAYRNHRGSQTFEHLALLGWLGITYDRLGRAAEAEPYLIEAVAVAEKLFPDPNSRLSGAYANLGRLYLNQGRLAEAGPLLQKAVAVSEAAGDGKTPHHAMRLHTIGLYSLEAERDDEAADELGQSVQLFEATLGKAHQRSRAARLSWLAAQAEQSSSVSVLRDTEALLDELPSDETGDASLRRETLLLIARLAARQDDTGRAQAALEAAMRLMADLDPGAPEAPYQLWMKGQALHALGRDEAAREAYLAAASGYEQAGCTEHPRRGRALLQAALLYPAGSPDRVRLGAQAREILSHQLKPPAVSLDLLQRL